MVNELLWQGIAAQTSLRDEKGAPCGLLQIADPDHNSGVSHLSVLIDPAAVADARQQCRSFLDESFGVLNLRKLCLDVTSDNSSVVALVDGAVCAGTLSAHERRNADTFVDLTLYEIWRRQPG
jgi:hypothetical protein